MDLPYHERQYIMFTRDPRVDHCARRLRAQACSTASGTTGAFALGAGMLSVVAKRNFPNRPVLTMAPAIIGAASAALQKPASSFAKSVLPEITIHTLNVRYANGLTLPMGHPMEKTVYVGHPVVPNTYYKLSDFHRKVFEDKVRELVNLLMSLGATEINIRSEAEQRTAVNAALSVAVADVEGRVSTEHRHLVEYQIVWAGNSEPSVPSGLVWYPTEAQWQDMARLRIDFRVQEFSSTFDCTEDFGVTARVVFILDSLGLRTFEYVNHRRTFLFVSAVFGNS